MLCISPSYNKIMQACYADCYYVLVPIMLQVGQCQILILYAGIITSISVVYCRSNFMYNQAPFSHAGSHK